MAHAIPIIPRKVLFGNPEKTYPQISPDGKKLAYLAPVNHVLNVWVGDLEKQDYKPITQDQDRGIRNYFWSEDSLNILYLQDKNGDENWQFFGTHIETGEVKSYTPYQGVQVHVLEHSHRFPSKVLLMINRDHPGLHDVYSLDLSSGSLEKVASNPGAVVGWLVDCELHVKGALAATAEGGFHFLIRSSQKEEWKKFITWSPEDSLNSMPLSFSADGKSVYVKDSRGINAARLAQISLESGEVESIFLQDDRYDVTDVLFHPDTYVPQLAAITKARKEWTLLDPSIAQDIQAITALHGGDFSIYNRSRDDSQWLVGFTADDGPVAFYLFDRKKQEGKFLFHHQPEFCQYTLSHMEPVSFPSKDGLTLHGYITYPPQVSKKNLPMVLKVHGGPWWRDTWGFEAEAQWLANRGYICLQINYRGSTGYGKDFLNAGNREWGGKMHQDLIDAVEWAIQQGIADPKKIAIYGGSYGGYAALVGATFTPDLFCCAVDIVGPSNLISFIQTVPEYWKSLLGMMYDRVGHPEKDEEFLKNRSPLFKIDQIRIPLLIAQGANDPRVKESESKQIVEALAQKNIPHDYMLFPDEGHGFAKPENRMNFYSHAEAFLAQHLGGRKE